MKCVIFIHRETRFKVSLFKRAFFNCLHEQRLKEIQYETQEFTSTRMLTCYANVLIMTHSSTDGSVNNTENLSPSLTPPPSAPSKSPQTHQTYMPKDGNESDDEHEIIEEDDEDSTEGRNTENASPNSQNKRKKKTRTVFSRAQVFQLESTFDMKR